jgi:hypothetical protein
MSRMGLQIKVAKEQKQRRVRGDWNRKSLLKMKTNQHKTCGCERKGIKLVAN